MVKLSSLSKQIGVGYLLILLIFIISLVLTLNKLDSIEKSINNIKELRSPTARASLMLLNGINHSLASLRGWMLIGYEEGGEKFKEERQNVWSNEISQSIMQLENLSVKWSNPENIKRLSSIKSLLKDFESYQKQIEIIANTSLNKPASHILLTEAAPRASSLIAEVTHLIELEISQPPSATGKQVLGILADIRESFGLCLASIRAYLLSGDKKSKLEFDQNWARNIDKFSQLALNKTNLSTEQLATYDKLITVHAQFSYLPEKIFAARAANDWDKAKYILKNNAAPLASEIQEVLANMVKNQDQLQTLEYELAVKQLESLKWLLITLLLIGSLTSVLVSLKIIRGVKTPLYDLIDIIKAMSQGKFDLTFRKSQVKEIHLLSKSVQLMKDNLLERNAALEQEKHKLEQEDWLKSNLTEVLENLPGHVDLKAFAQELLYTLVPKVNGLVAAIYIAQNDNSGVVTLYDTESNGDGSIDEGGESLKLISAYAYPINDIEQAPSIRFGEGLVGQCALSQKGNYVSNLNNASIPINSTFVKTPAKHVALLPISFENELLGVLEIAAHQEFTILNKRLMEQVVNNAGLILKAVLGRIETEKLLTFLNKQNVSLNEHTQSLVEAKELADLANKDLAAQKTAMDHHSLVSVTDVSGIITYANDKFCEVSGYDREELIGKNHNLLNSNNQPKRYWEKMFEDVAKYGVWHDEVYNRAKDGHYYWVDTTIVPLYSAEGKLNGYTSIRTDISHQKEIITRMDEANKLADIANKDLATQKTAMDHHSLVSVTDIEGNITYANDKFCAVSGYEREELIGKNHNLLNSNKQPKSYWKDMFEQVVEHGVWHDEVCNRAKDGHYYWVDTTIVPLYSAEGKLNGYTSIRTDISHQKETITRLDDAKKQAEIANESKTEFLANMSHEIRTPMNGVIGMTNLLLDTQLNQEQQSFARTVKSSAESLLTVINDILDFSKVEAGMLELELLEFDLDQLMYELGSNFAFRAYEKNIELICPANVMLNRSFIADPGRVRQILNNLIGNAIKFTDSGEVSVQCSIKKQTKQYSELKFEVTDSGIGLTKDQQKKLFERFSQADGSTTREYGGTGLGLSISKQLVELMGGKIGVNSDKNKGSTFWFTLKLENAKVQSSPLSFDKLTSQKILVVDDNATNRALMEQLLSKWNVEHSLAASGSQALKSLMSAQEEGRPYDIAVIDMQMPEMDGLELGKTIQDDKLLNKTKLVMLTSQGQRGDAEKSKSFGYSSYLNKPIDQIVLFNTLIKTANIESTKQEIITAYSQSSVPQFSARVLVVEDNAVNQKVAQGLLKKFGVQVELAADGQEAIYALENLPFDLVFMDCQMPVMDGYQASRHIRSENSKVLNSKIPIIAMTANTMQGDREKCLSVGMDDFISKPINPIKVQEALSRWLTTSNKHPEEVCIK